MRGGSCLRDIRRPRPSPRQGRRLGHRRCGTCSVSEPSNTSNRPRQRRPGTLAIAMWVCHSHLLLSLCGFATAICYYRRSKLPFARLQRPKTLRGSFDQARRPQPSATIGVRSCRLPAFKRPKTLRGSFHRQLRPGTQATAICYYQRSRLPLACPQKLPTLRGSFDQARRPQPSRRSKLPFARLQRTKTLRGSFDQALRPLSSASIGVWGCRLPNFKNLNPKTFRGTCDQALRPQPSATISVRGCLLPAFNSVKRSAAASTRPQTSGTIGVRSCRLPAFKGLKPSAAASTRHAGHSHLLLSAFEAAVCPPSKA